MAKTDSFHSDFGSTTWISDGSDPGRHPKIHINGVIHEVRQPDQGFLRLRECSLVNVVIVRVCPLVPGRIVQHERQCPVSNYPLAHVTVNHDGCDFSDAIEVVCEFFVVEGIAPRHADRRRNQDEESQFHGFSCASA